MLSSADHGNTVAKQRAGMSVAIKCEHIAAADFFVLFTLAHWWEVCGARGVCVCVNWMRANIYKNIWTHYQWQSERETISCPIEICAIIIVVGVNPPSSLNKTCFQFAVYLFELLYFSSGGFHFCIRFCSLVTIWRPFFALLITENFLNER